MFLLAEPLLRASIMVNGLHLSEYDDADSPPSKNNKTAYVEAEAGSNFSVMVTTDVRMAKTGLDCISVSVHMDGKYMTEQFIRVGKRNLKQWTEVKGVWRNVAGGSTFQNFCFAHLQTDDSAIDSAKVADYKDLGTIQVSCHWVRVRSTHPLRHKDYSDAPAEVSSSVPEKCLKGRAISSQAALGPATQSRTKIEYTSLKRVYGPEPLAKFTFKYRSRRDLQVEGIIPRSPSPVPLEDRDPDTLTLEESRELVRRLKQREQQQQIKTKKETHSTRKRERSRAESIGMETDDEGVSITSQGPVRKRTRPSTDSGVELVDLTQD